MHHRTLKNLLYEQVAVIGRALASPKRLEILELLAQGEKTVETLTAELEINVKLVSAHLRALKTACLVHSRSVGKYRIYRLRDDGVAQLGVVLRGVATQHLLDLQAALRELVHTPDHLVGTDRRTLLSQARRGTVVVIDVRPQHEYDTAHLPCARSMPLAELELRLAELPRDKTIVAYCRGPFCMMSDAAVKLLLAHGFSAHILPDGVSEWRAAGLPLQTQTGRSAAGGAHRVVAGSAA